MNFIWQSLKNFYLWVNGTYTWGGIRRGGAEGHYESKSRRKILASTILIFGSNSPKYTFRLPTILLTVVKIRLFFGTFCIFPKGIYSWATTLIKMLVLEPKMITFEGDPKILEIDNLSIYIKYVQNDGKQCSPLRNCFWDFAFYSVILKKKYVCLP